MGLPYVRTYVPGPSGRRQRASLDLFMCSLGSWTPFYKYLNVLKINLRVNARWLASLALVYVNPRILNISIRADTCTCAHVPAPVPRARDLVNGPGGAVLCIIIMYMCDVKISIMMARFKVRDRRECPDCTQMFRRPIQNPIYFSINNSLRVSVSGLPLFQLVGRKDGEAAALLRRRRLPLVLRAAAAARALQPRVDGHEVVGLQLPVLAGLDAVVVVERHPLVALAGADGALRSRQFFEKRGGGVSRGGEGGVKKRRMEVLGARL